MKVKVLFSVLCMTPMVANAAIPYRVEQVKMPAAETPYGHDAEAFARNRRFYIGGAYNYSIWDNYTDDENISVTGKNTSAYEGYVGIRLYDVFRIEANYIHSDVKYDEFKFNAETAMINALFDARIDNLYRLFYRQRLVPYVGLGAGLSWARTDDVHADNKYTPAMAALAGLGIELGNRFALDFGYRYFYMFSPKFDGISDLAPTAHMLRAGARVNF